MGKPHPAADCLAWLDARVDYERTPPAEAARMKRGGYEPILTKSRWCLLKRRENLTENQATRLAELLQYNLKSVRAHLLRELFQQVWDYMSPT